MDIVVNEALKAYIEPLTPDEHAALERSLLNEGCRDALVLWGNVLVDGHNRYGICQQHGILFQTAQNHRFQSMEDVNLWMIDQHLGRRSLSDFQRGVLALRKRDIVAERRTRQAAVAPNSEPVQLAGPAQTLDTAPAPTTQPDAFNTREALAKAARLSSNQVVQIEKIQKQGAPELVNAVKAGMVSIHAAATVASLPMAEQVAVAAGGAEELRQAAKRVRDGRRKSLPPADLVGSLRERVASLEADNAALRAELATLRGG